ncbi:MAG: TonB-dependent receptor [Flavobacteriaceae bacterium]|nr:TonB-dependent receptor [Flavobacteriaceae bacterium]
MKKRLLFLTVLLATATFAQQKEQDSIKVENLQEIIITATKIATEKKNLGKVVYQITPQMIEISKGKTILDLLNDVPGVEINGNYSTASQNLGYYIRGGRNKQVVVLIDGIPVSDPSSYNNDFDLRQLSIDQIEKIEVLKGATSTLYGTGATTGVINIILKKALNKGFAGSFNTHIGTNASQEHLNTNINEISSTLNLNGSVHKFDYLVSLNALQSKGLSAAEGVDKNISLREDPYVRYNSLIKLGYSPTKKLRIGVFGSYDEFTSHYDGYDYISGTYVDADNVLKSIQKRVGVTPKFTYEKGELTINGFYTQVDRNISPTSDIYKGEALGFDVFNNYKFTNSLQMLTGIASQYQDMYQKTAYSSIEEGSAKQHFYDPYVSLNYFSKGLNVNVGTRINIHSEYGSHFVYNINPSYNIYFTDTTVLKILTSYSTAYITPTLQEIFNKLPSIGELNPERDKNIEAGFDLTLTDKLNFNAVYFYREEADKIGYDYTTYQSINDEGTFIAKGYEVSLQYKPINSLVFSANYSFIDREESLLLKIPKHKANMNVLYKINDRTNVSFNGKFVDATKDYGNLNLPSYRIVDAFFNRKVMNDRVTLFASVTNIFNEDFQEIAGFSTRGRNYRLGLQVNF